MITSPEGSAKKSLARAVEEAVRGGADVVQLRDKKAGDRELLAQARELLKVTRALGVPLIINDRVSVARESGADGVHLGQEDGPLDEARRSLGESALIGRSTHSPDQALAAQREGFDYIGVGPVYETPTKAGRAAVGLELIRFASKKLEVPFVAIGGIDTGNLRQVMDAGARRVAVVRAVMAQEGPAREAQRFLEIINGCITEARG